MNIELFYKLFLLIFVAILANLPYKGKLFENFKLKTFLVCITSFATGAFVLIYVSKDNFLTSLNFVSLFIFIVVFLFWFLSPYIFRFFGKYPKRYINDPENKIRFLAKFELHSMTIKFFEVLFQQSMFIYLLFSVLNFESFSTNLPLFVFMVAVIHLGNLPFLGTKWTLIYTALSIPMAFIFGYLILKGHIFITISIHLLFYLWFNGRLWFQKKYSI